jgi:hypothetical protein
MITAVTSETYGWIALAIGLVAALVVAALLAMLLLQTTRIRTSVEGLLKTAGEAGANTAHIPKLEATAPVLAAIVDEAVIQDGYMNALTDGFGEELAEGGSGNGAGRAAAEDAQEGAQA